MTVSMVARHKVKNFAAWKAVYDEAASIRQEGGVTDDAVHRDVDDANTVMVYHQFADVSAAKAFAAMFDTEEFQAIIKKGGIIEPVEMWLGEVVE